MTILKKLLFTLFIPVLFLNNLNAEKINDKAALNGIKEAKSVFLIDFTNVRKTAFYLNIIEGTHKGLIKQGVKPK